MSIIKLNNRSVKDITAFGSISSLGSLTHIATQTASSSSSISFTSGIDSTYKEYIFYFVNLHRSANGFFQFNMSSDGGSNYNVTKTTTFFYAYNHESPNDATLNYVTGWDKAQDTGSQRLANGQSGSADECTSGFLHLFNPSSTTFVKHFMAHCISNNSPYCEDNYCAGYGNTTSAINAVKFEMSSGNIDSGQILLFGLN